MHHVLSTTRWASLSGTKVAWDFVEFPSTVFEKLLDVPGVLAHLSSHARTGAPLPPALIERCLVARRFRTASMLVQGVGLAQLGASWDDLAGGGARFRDLVLARGNEAPPRQLVDDFTGT